MSEDQGDVVPGRFSQHKFLLLISGSVLMALVLTIISMSLYAWSGTAQLDLSRPGYQSVQKEAKSNEKFDGFSGTGDINSKVLDDFKKMYDKQTAQVSGIDAFSGDVLDDASLKIDDPALGQTQQNQ
jgi:hypothetical protein